MVGQLEALNVRVTKVWVWHKDTPSIPYSANCGLVGNAVLAYRIRRTLEQGPIDWGWLDPDPELDWDQVDYY